MYPCLSWTLGEVSPAAPTPRNAVWFRRGLGRHRNAPAGARGPFSAVAWWVHGGGLQAQLSPSSRMHPAEPQGPKTRTDQPVFVSPTGQRVPACPRPRPSSAPRRPGREWCSVSGGPRSSAGSRPGPRRCSGRQQGPHPPQNPGPGPQSGHPLPSAGAPGWGRAPHQARAPRGAPRVPRVQCRPGTGGRVASRSAGCGRRALQASVMNRVQPRAAGPSRGVEPPSPSSPTLVPLPPWGPAGEGTGRPPGLT